MTGLFNLLLFIITFAGGSIAIYTRGLNNKNMHYLLAFSGAFLLSITLLHLLPETFSNLGAKTGIFLLAGFFIQLIIQRLTHGTEHGHLHTGDHMHTTVLTSIIIGLLIHAIMDGIPLGSNSFTKGAVSSLYLGIASHKMPEAMLVGGLIKVNKSKTRALLIIFLFALITPVTAFLTGLATDLINGATQVLIYLIAIVAGAFINISTTIFFESGTKQHKLTWQMVLAMLLGVGIGLLTLSFE
jgi:zinc transporter ZupT